jgi:hypothetical protein
MRLCRTPQASRLADCESVDEVQAIFAKKNRRQPGLGHADICEDVHIA